MTWLTHIQQRFPGLLIALFAWLIARGGLWLVHMQDASWWRIANADGLPLWRLLHGTLPHGVMLGLGEAFFALGAWAVYTAVRQDALPQTSDRAVWLWAFCPLGVLVTPGGSWIWAVGWMLMGFALLAKERAALSALFCGLAVAIRPECVLFVPALWWVSQKRLSSGRHAWWHGPFVAFAPLGSLLLSVVAAIGFAGANGISIREFYSASWKLPWEIVSWVDGSTGWLIASTLGVLALTIRYCRERLHLHWLSLIIPPLCLLWFVQSPAQVAPLCLCAYPLFALWAKSIENPVLERIVFALCALGLWVAL